MTMQAFQSWTDIIIMLVLLIAYVLTFIAQRNTIKAKNETILAMGETLKALESQIGAVKSITDVQTSSFTTYREMINIDDLKKHHEWQVEWEVTQKMEVLIKEIINEETFLPKAAQLIKDDVYKFCFANLRFVMYVFRQNNSSNDTIKKTVNAFFPESKWVEKVFLEDIEHFRASRPTHESLPDIQKNLPEGSNS